MVGQYNDILFKLILLSFFFFLHQKRFFFFFFLLSRQQAHKFERCTLIQSQQLNWQFQMWPNVWLQFLWQALRHSNMPLPSTALSAFRCTRTLYVFLFKGSLSLVDYCAHLYFFSFFGLSLNSVHLDADCRTPPDSLNVFKIYYITQNQSAVSLFKKMICLWRLSFFISFGYWKWAVLKALLLAKSVCYTLLDKF